MLPVVFFIGAGTGIPSVAVGYQAKVIPEIGAIALLASSVCIGDNSHSVILPVEMAALGAGLMVNITAVLEYEGQVPSLDCA